MPIRRLLTIAGALACVGLVVLLLDKGSAKRDRHEPTHQELEAEPESESSWVVNPDDLPLVRGNEVSAELVLEEDDPLEDDGEESAEEPAVSAVPAPLPPPLVLEFPPEPDDEAQEGGETEAEGAEAVVVQEVAETEAVEDETGEAEAVVEEDPESAPEPELEASPEPEPGEPLFAP